MKNEKEKIEYLAMIIKLNPLDKVDFEYLTGRLEKEKSKIFKRKSQFGNKKIFIEALKLNSRIMVMHQEKIHDNHIIEFQGSPGDYLKKFYNTSLEIINNK